MSGEKITNDELRELLKTKSVSEIAAMAGTSVQAIYKRKRKMDVKKHLPKAVIKKAEKLVTGNLNLMEEINGLIQNLKDTLDKIDEELTNAKSNEKDKKRLLKLSHISELRQVIKTLADIGKIITDVKEIKYFQQTVIEEISKESPDVARRIIARLSKRSVVHGVIERA